MAIRDSGRGIDPAHFDRVFNAFYTTKSSRTGMGLAIYRSIIDSHGGRLWIEANEPRGAVFHSPCPAPILLRGVIGTASRAKTPHEILFINWLTKVADDPVV
jgi:light-regulated signal transduction histidine kinase (bacteriophytochrome)